MAPDEATIPVWAADIKESVAEIRGLAGQIPTIINELKDLRANTVPMQEHIKLLNDVDVLKERDLGARSDWEDVKARVLDDKGMLSVIWEERSQLRGAIAVLRVSSVITGLVVAVLTIFTLLRGLGMNITFGH